MRGTDWTPEGLRSFVDKIAEQLEILQSIIMQVDCRLHCILQVVMKSS